MTRVEVTMDGGETWQVCRLDHPEKPNKYSKYWCWCFWSLEVEVLDLIGAKEIAVRAWDETLNTQPEKLIWNVMVCSIPVSLQSHFDACPLPYVCRGNCLVPTSRGLGPGPFVFVAVQCRCGPIICWGS